MLSFLTLGSALNATLEKSFFTLSTESGLMPQLFQTRTGIIAYAFGINYDSGSLYPQYYLLNIENKNVTPILQDLITSCDQGPSDLDRVHYHALTYNLVYYCSNNNSLLILDETDYTVKTVIPTGINQILQEVRLTSDGYSVSILGLTGLLSSTPSPTHLVKVSLQTQTVTTHVIFDHDLASGEAVTAYASSGQNMYVVTNTVTGTTPSKTSVYSMTLIGSSYSLTLLASINSTSEEARTIPELYCVENLLITNQESTLIILNNKGNVLQQIETLQQIEYVSPTGTDGSYYRVELFADYGASDFYALWINSTITKFTAQSGGFSFEDFGSAGFMYFALQDQNTNSLLLTVATDNVGNFTITDLSTSEILYVSAAAFFKIMITDSTYTVVNFATDALAYIFDRETDALIQLISVGEIFYYDQQRSIFSSLIHSGLGQYQLQQIDLTTGNVYSSLKFNYTGDSVGFLVHATNNENFDTPEVVIKIIDYEAKKNNYLIISPKFGQAEFTVPSSDLEVSSTLFPDYDALTIYYFAEGDPNSTTLDVYTYDPTSKSFTLKDSTNQIIGGTTIPSNQYAVVVGTQELGIVNYTTLDQTVVSISAEWDSISPFDSNTDDVRIIVSRSGRTSQNANSVGIYYNGQFEDLPGSIDNATISAGVAGACSYDIVTGTGSFSTISIYNICSQEEIMKIES